MHRGVGVHDGSRPVAVDRSQMKVYLRGGREGAVKVAALPVDDADVLGPDVGEQGACRVMATLSPARWLTFPAVPSTSPSDAERRATVATRSLASPSSTRRW
jgi:L-ascorbate metabolism protein UlaG (beta-lactamase superfamily)